MAKEVASMARYFGHDCPYEHVSSRERDVINMAISWARCIARDNARRRAMHEATLHERASDDHWWQVMRKHLLPHERRLFDRVALHLRMRKRWLPGDPQKPHHSKRA